MIIKTNLDKLRALSERILNKTDQFANEKSKFLDLVNTLPNYLDHTQADPYINNVTNYINSLKKLESDLRTFSTILKRSSSAYKNKNESFKRDIAKGDEELYG